MHNLTAAATGNAPQFDVAALMNNPAMLRLLQNSTAAQKQFLAAVLAPRTSDSQKQQTRV